MNTIQHPVDNGSAVEENPGLGDGTVVVVEGPATALASGTSNESVLNIIFAKDDPDEDVRDIGKLDIHFQQSAAVAVAYRFFTHAEIYDHTGLEQDGSVEWEFIAGKISLAGVDDPDVVWRANEESLQKNRIIAPHKRRRYSV